MTATSQANRAIEAAGITLAEVGRTPEPLWPQPMKPEAYHGITGDIVRAIEPHSEADPHALLVTTLVELGNALGSNPHAKAEAARHGANIFAVLAGESSRARKGSSEGHIRSLLDRVDPEFVANNIKSGLSSGEGLVWNLRDAEPEVDEDGDAIEVIDDKRRLIIEAEFSRTLKVMGREANTLSDVLRQAWDNNPIDVMTRSNPLHASGAHLSVLGHIVKKELLRWLKDSEAANGFGNRFLWVCARRSKLLPRGGGVPSWGLLVPRLKEALDKGRNIVAEMRRDEQAELLWDGLYTELTKGHPGLWGDITARAEAQVLRLSVIYAALDGSAVIRTQHLKAATAVWEYCDASARCIFGDATGDTMADQISDAMRWRGRMDKSSLYGLFGNNPSAQQINKSLKILLDADLIACIPELPEGGGKPKEFWVWKGTDA
jgi:hypothetical protein